MNKTKNRRKINVAVPLDRTNVEDLYLANRHRVQNGFWKKMKRFKKCTENVDTLTLLAL